MSGSDRGDHHAVRRRDRLSVRARYADGDERVSLLHGDQRSLMDGEYERTLVGMSLEYRF